MLPGRRHLYKAMPIITSEVNRLERSILPTHYDTTAVLFPHYLTFNQEEFLPVRDRCDPAHPCHEPRSWSARTSRSMCRALATPTGFVSR
jgi:hypothetical protein